MNKQIKNLLANCMLTFSLLLSAVTYAVTPAEELASRFSKIDSFSGSFQQKVIGPKNEVLVTSKGTLSIKRPNLFRWYTSAPDENLIVSDGKSVFFHDVELEQVTAMRFRDAMAQTPFILLTNASTEDWKKYKITQKNDDFTLVPISKKDSVSSLKLTVNSGGVIKKFTLIGKDKQKNEFTLSNIRREEITHSRFEFVIPRGVELDDQRK